MWGKTELVVGQIGKVTILKDTPLVQIENGKFVTVRTLKKGDEFRVYNYQANNGGLYGVGSSSFIQKNATSVKYETPSKAKLAELARINGGSTAQPYKPAEQVGSIKALYGKHTYGTKTQAEYDAVIKRAKEEFAKHKNDAETIDALDRYLSGERSSGGLFDDSSVLDVIENSYGALIKNGVSRAEIITLIQAGDVSSNLLSGTKDPLDGSPRSAYDAIVRKVSDCDPIGEVQSPSFDMKGYSTMIVAGENHADVYVKVKGKWFAYGAGTFLETSKSPTSLNAGQYIMSQPTF